MNDDYGGASVAAPEANAAVGSMGLTTRELNPISKCHGALAGQQLELHHTSYLYKKIDGKYGHGDSRFWGRNKITDPDEMDDPGNAGAWPAPPEKTQEQRQKEHDARIKNAKMQPPSPHLTAPKNPKPKKKKEQPKQDKGKKDKPQDNFKQHEQDIMKEEPELTGLKFLFSIQLRNKEGTAFLKAFMACLIRLNKDFLKNVFLEYFLFYQ